MMHKQTHVTLKCFCFFFGHKNTHTNNNIIIRFFFIIIIIIIIHFKWIAHLSCLLWLPTQTYSDEMPQRTEIKNELKWNEESRKELIFNDIIKRSLKKIKGNYATHTPLFRQQTTSSSSVVRFHLKITHFLF